MPTSSNEITIVNICRSHLLGFRDDLGAVCEAGLAGNLLATNVCQQKVFVWQSGVEVVIGVYFFFGWEK